MTVKLLTEHHLEFLSLKGGCAGWSESTCLNATLLEMCICHGSYCKLFQGLALIVLDIFYVLHSSPSFILSICSSPVIIMYSQETWKTVYILVSRLLRFCMMWFFTAQSTIFKVMSGWIFLGWTSTKQVVMCLAQEHNAERLVRVHPTTSRSWVKPTALYGLLRSQLIWICTYFLIPGLPGFSMVENKQCHLSITFFKRLVVTKIW